MPFEQTHTELTMDEIKPSIDLVELCKYFPDITIFNFLFSAFSKISSNLEQCHKEIQLLLEEVKNNDLLLDTVVKAIANVEALSVIANSLSKKQIIINDLKQRCQAEFSPHYLRAVDAEIRLKAIKEILAINIDEVVNKFDEEKRNETIDNLLLTATDILDSNNIHGPNTAIVDEKLEKSALYIVQLINDAITRWSYEKQTKLINQITKTAELLSAELHFTPFNAWQKNLLLARLHAGFIWSEQCKSLEASYTKEKAAVSKKLLEEPFASYANLSFAEEELLLHDINLTIVQIRASLANYQELFDMQSKVKTYLDDCENLSSLFNTSLMVSTFKQIANTRQSSGNQQVKLADQIYDLTDDTFEHYLKDLNAVLEHHIAKLRKMSDLLLNTKELPVVEDKRQTLCNKLKRQSDEINRSYQEILRIKALFANIERDLHSARNHVADRKTESLRLANEAKLLKAQKALKSLEKEVAVLDLKQVLGNQQQTSSKLGSAHKTFDTALQQQITFFENQRKLFLTNKEVIEHLTIDDNDFSDLDALNDDLNEALNHMKVAYRNIKGFKINRPRVEITDESDDDLSNQAHSRLFFLKKHWQKILFNTVLFSCIAVTGLFLSGGLLPLATALAEALLISTPAAGAMITMGVATLGGIIGLSSGSIGVGLIKKPIQNFWKNHWRDVLIGTGIGLAALSGIIGITFLGFATFGIGPLAVLSAFGSATAASLTVFGANITTAAGVATGFSFLTTAVAAISATVTAFVAAIFDGKRKQLPPPNAQSPDQIEVINPDIDPDDEPDLTHRNVNKKLREQPTQEISQKHQVPTSVTKLTESDIATLLTSFQETPKLSHSPHGFHNQEKPPSDSNVPMNNRPLNHANNSPLRV